MTQRMAKVCERIGVLIAAAAVIAACGPEGSSGPIGLNPCLSNPVPAGCPGTGDTGGGADATGGDEGGPTQDVPGPGDGGGTEDACTPSCGNNTCGPNGCGGVCGSCTAEGTTCIDGACVEGECGAGGLGITGQFKVAEGIDFDKATVEIEHKMDIDEFEDGCLSRLVIDLGKGFGCTLHIEAGAATHPSGTGLRITDLSFSADSQCPGFPDESEGTYDDFSGLTLARVIPSADKVPDRNSPESCLTAGLTVELEGSLVESGTLKTLNVVKTTIVISGEYPTLGSTTSSCPCEASCSGKECGDDGCGYDCGTCGPTDFCNASGQCECEGFCDPGWECGDDGCGGTCGAGCGEFEACGDLNECVACEPQCEGRSCGDNGCGGECGPGCAANETCSAAGACECGGVTCADACCDSGAVCASGECCMPQCDGKTCGGDGCGGSCGTCDAGQTCSGGGQCQCVPECSLRECGDDGCGSTCGPGCGGGETCNDAGMCVSDCASDCLGKECGSDGCGGTCGPGCGGGETCNATGVCEGGGGSCDINGFFASAGERAFDNSAAVSYFALDGDTTFDALSIEIWDAAVVPGTYNISADGYETCALCVVVFQNCPATARLGALHADCPTAYLASAGQVQIDTVGGVGSTFTGTILISDLGQVDIDADTFVSTPVSDGQTWCVDGYPFAATVEAPAP